MYKKILAPLDGSKLAECTLDHVQAVASGCNVPEVVLLSVVDVMPVAATGTSDTEAVDADWLNRTKEQGQDWAKGYLSKTAAKLKKGGLAVDTAVVTGKPAEAILDYALKNNVDLIVMSTHGRSGVARWFMGSVADRIVNAAPVPVLLVAPPGCRVIGALD